MVPKIVDQSYFLKSFPVFNDWPHRNKEADYKGEEGESLNMEDNENDDPHVGENVKFNLAIRNNYYNYHNNYNFIDIKFKVKAYSLLNNWKVFKMMLETKH